jgi:dTDP-4-dehydrorhamnose reductase
MKSPLSIVVVGGRGRLGQSLIKRWLGPGVVLHAITRDEMDLDQPPTVVPALAGLDFDLLINAAGMVEVDACELRPGELQRVNVVSPAEMAKVCAKKGARMIQVSTDYVFSGCKPGLLGEDDLTEPCNAYGRSKLAAEAAVAASLPDALIARVSWLFGGHKGSFPDRILSNALSQTEVRAVQDKWACPTYVEDLCDWLYQWAILQPWQGGVLHLCNSGQVSWADYGQAVLDMAAEMGLPLRTRQIVGHSMVGFAPFIAERPAHTALSTEKFSQRTGIAPRPWQEALREHLQRTQARA